MAHTPLTPGRLALRILAAGAVLWLAQAWLAAPAREQIVVGEELREGLRNDHRRRTGRPPSAAEERALIDAYVDDEVLYREALALGLDRGDVVIRRRLVQNMGFLLEEENALGEPSDADLAAHLAANAGRFTVPERLSFVHVYLPGRAADAPGAADPPPDDTAEEIRAQLAAGGDPALLGTPFPRGARFTRVTTAEIDAVFGPGFGAHLAALPVGTWSPAPLPSSYGRHLVRLDGRVAPALPALDAIRTEVAGEWRDERRREAERRGLARLRERYDVVRDEPSRPRSAEAAQ
jgi:hypothetical protein